MKNPRNISPIPIAWPLQIFGFFIGCVVVRNVRKALHAEFLDESARQVVNQERRELAQAGIPFAGTKSARPDG